MLIHLKQGAVSLSDYGLKRSYATVKNLSAERYLGFCDETTLFYGGFYSFDGRHIILVGPPPSGFYKALSSARFIYKGRTLRFKIRKLKQALEIWVRIPKDMKPNPMGDEIQLEMNGRTSSLIIGQNNAPRFKGRRVLSSLCKDTPVAWIIDWLQFHITNHGVDALILFENSDTPEHAEKIHQAIEALNLDIVLDVVHVPFKFGPPLVYDYMYLQISLLQYLRWHSLPQAEAVLCCDIDELIITEKGCSVFDSLKNSFFGYYLIAGVWIEPVLDEKSTPPKKLEDLRHTFFTKTTNPYISATRKWIAKPNAIPKKLQLKIHGIRPEPKYVSFLHPLYARFRPFLKGATLCHFKAMSTSWKEDRTTIVQNETDDYKIHNALLKAFKKAFPERF